MACTEIDRKGHTVIRESIMVVEKKMTALGRYSIRHVEHDLKFAGGRDTPIYVLVGCHAYLS
jgi:hypothetical protein